MLEYSKIILEKVSFDAFLFEKEFRKFRKLLQRGERSELEHWCHINYYTVYPDLISKLILKK